jgi:hypothetical protein
VVLLFGLTAFTGAGLLFLVQPMVAKLLLPSYGGSPMVWNTSTLFFQVLLLLGYLYVHVSTTRLGRRQPWLQAAVLALPLLALPLALPAQAVPPEGADPALWLLRTLLLAVGLPFLVLATTSTALQRWFSWLGHPRSADPYFLYAASNAGSFVGLLAYPFLLEPLLTLAQQRAVWSMAYAAFVAMFLACGALTLVRGRVTAPSVREGAAATKERLTWSRRGRWLFLAFVPSSLMLGVTTFITTDVAALPLLWVLPLAIYLATFVVAFGRSRRVVSPGLVLAAASVAVACLVSALRPGLLPLSLALVLHLGGLALVALAAHSVLAADRPSPERLTEYFVVVAVGGAMGGLLNGLLAPVVFDSPVEYPLVLALVPVAGFGLLVPGLSPLDQGRSVARRATLMLLPVLLAGAGAAGLVVGFAPVLSGLMLILGLAGIASILAGRPAVLVGLAVGAVAATALVGSPVVQDRTFFGTYRVSATAEVHSLRHGTTLHGLQWQDERRDQPTTYYARSGPLGDVFAALEDPEDPPRVGGVGLGAGTIAAYGVAGQQMRFYEIDPAIRDIATDPDLFTFLADSAADTDVVVGDGRLRVEEEPDDTFDLLVLDAFSSDAIPVHLLTLEAFEVYDRVTADDGLIAVHVSNRHFTLDPVVLAAARELGLTGVVRSASGGDDGATLARWVVLSRTEGSLADLVDREGWEPLDGEARLWTDDYSSVVGVLRL